MRPRAASSASVRARHKRAQPHGAKRTATLRPSAARRSESSTPKTQARPVHAAALPPTRPPGYQKTMPKDECRESRPVPFSAEGIAWAAAAAGAVRQSVGVDVDATGRLLPSPRRPLPFQRQQRPFASAAGSVGPAPPRRPLAPLEGNADVIHKALSVEVRALERKLMRADHHARVQDQLIRDFCQLELARANAMAD